MASPQWEVLGVVTMDGGANSVKKLSDVFPQLNSVREMSNVNAVFIQAGDTNAGKSYVGDLTMNILTNTGIAFVLPVPTANSIPGITIACGTGLNAVPLRSITVGAASNNDTVRVSVIRA